LRELGIDRLLVRRMRRVALLAGRPFPKPALLGAPAQALLDQEFIDATAFDRDPFLLVEIRFQAIQRPTPEGQAQVGRLAQRGSQDLPDVFGRIRGRAPGTRLIDQTVQTRGIEPFHPEPNDSLADPHLARNR
jgi:hypothetical protein